MNAPQPMSYSVNREGAIKGSGIPRVTVKGAYVGTFTRAEHTVSRRNTSGIDFTFVTDDGAVADFLTVWTHKGDGEELSGRALLDALMTCMAVRTLEPKRGRIEKYDPQARERVMMEATLYPELMDKPVGLLLVVEEYLGNDGSTKRKMMIQGAFEPTSRKTAKEIWEKGQAKALPTLIAGLRDRLLPPGAAQAAYGHQGGGYDHAGFSPDEDSIPF